eukprot:SAG31_NODE_793_length_12044_cov_12.886229_3_plen_224_part_00
MLKMISGRRSYVYRIHRVAGAELFSGFEVQRDSVSAHGRNTARGQQRSLLRQRPREKSSAMSRTQIWDTRSIENRREVGVPNLSPGQRKQRQNGAEAFEEVLSEKCRDAARLLAKSAAAPGVLRITAASSEFDARCRAGPDFTSQTSPQPRMPHLTTSIALGAGAGPPAERGAARRNQGPASLAAIAPRCTIPSIRRTVMMLLNLDLLNNIKRPYIRYECPKY